MNLDPLGAVVKVVHLVSKANLDKEERLVPLVKPVHPDREVNLVRLVQLDQLA